MVGFAPDRIILAPYKSASYSVFSLTNNGLEEVGERLHRELSMLCPCYRLRQLLAPMLGDKRTRLLKTAQVTPPTSTQSMARPKQIP